MGRKVGQEGANDGPIVRTAARVPVPSRCTSRICQQAYYPRPCLGIKLILLPQEDESALPRLGGKRHSKGPTGREIKNWRIRLEGTTAITAARELAKCEFGRGDDAQPEAGLDKSHQVLVKSPCQLG